MTTIPYTIPVPATNEQEGNQKAEALSRLARELDGKTLKALADKGPSLLRNSPFAAMIRRTLGLE